MQIVIAALLVVIVLILLGLFGPVLLGLIWALVTVAPALFTVGAIFLVILAGVIVYHVVKESREARSLMSSKPTTSGVSEQAKARGSRSVHDW